MGFLSGPTALFLFMFHIDMIHSRYIVLRNSGTNTMRIIDQHHVEINGHHIPLRHTPIGSPPSQPTTFIERPHQYALINELVGAHHHITIHGMPGCGKTTLAQQYAHGNALPGGVLWVTVGPNFSSITSYTTLVDWMLSALDVERLPVGYEVQSNHLQAILALMQPCLVVFDDVHHSRDIDNLRAALPHHARVIITTRQQQVVNDLGMHTIEIHQFEPAQALALMASALEQPLNRIEEWEWCHDLAAAVAFHPLAIRLVTRYLRQHSTQPHDWAHVAERIIHELPIDPWQELLNNDTVSAGIQPLLARSFAVLSPMERQILYSIAVCAPASDISVTFMAHLWDLDADQMRRALKKLIDLSLIEPGYAYDSWRQHIVLRTYTLLQMALHNAHVAIQLTVIQRTTTWINHHIQQYSFQQMHDDYRHMEYLFGQALVHHPANAVEIAYGMSHYHDAMGNYREQLSWSTHLLHHIEHHEYTDLLVDTYMLAAMDLFEMGIHTGEQRVRYFQQGYDLFQRANQLQAKTNPRTNDPEIANRFGIALQEYATLPDVDRLQILDDAVDLYAHIRHLPGINTPLYVSICQNYANTLAARAKHLHPNGSRDFEAAIAACDEGLQWLPQTTTSYHFIGLHMTKSSIYSDYAEIAVDRQTELLTAALQSSSDALHYLDEHDDPQRYAQFMMNRANLCTSFIDILDVDHHKYLNLAYECINEALKYRTVERVPLEYSWTKHNQAYLLRHLATLEGVDRHTMLREAIKASHEALRFRIKESVPEHFMRTAYQQAEIYRDLADISAPALRIEMLQQGLAACDAAIEVAVQYPSHWRAAISDLKSSLLYRLAPMTPESADSLLTAARTANNVGLEVYAPTDHVDLAEVWLNRMHIEYIAYQYAINAPIAFENLQLAAKTALKHTTQGSIQAPLLAQIYIDIASLLLALPVAQPQRQHALVLAQNGLDLAKRLHHSPLQLKAHQAILQATKPA